MTGWRYDIVLAIVLAMIAVFVPMLVLFTRIGNELYRARRAGEATHIPINTGPKAGLPAVVIFTKDALPRVERERRILVRLLIAFGSLWAMGVGFIAVFGPHKH